MSARSSSTNARAASVRDVGDERAWTPSARRRSQVTASSEHAARVRGATTQPVDEDNQAHDATAAETQGPRERKRLPARGITAATSAYGDRA